MQYRDGLITEDEAVEKFREHMLKYANYEYKESEMKLTANRVEEILIDCLFKEGEDTSNHVLTEGVIGKFGLHPERLSSYKDEIKSLLLELPDDFQKSMGGGMSFLQACEDKHGIQWGEHRSIDNLLILGIATKQAKILMPRDMWSLFPGGMPYFVVLD